MEHVLFKLEKIKIAFEQHWPINFKLYYVIFNYFKFYVINYFI